MKEKILMGRLVIKFVKDCFAEEIKLSKIIDGDRNDSDGIFLFIAIEEGIKVWISVFLIDKEKVDNYFSTIIHTKFIEEEQFFNNFKMPSIDDIEEGYDKAGKINFSILKEEYADETFYKWIDELVDIVCPDYLEQPIYIEHGENYPEGVIQLKSRDF